MPESRPEGDPVPLEGLAPVLVGAGMIAGRDELRGCRRIGQGQSNLTFLLELSGGRSVVLRRPPPGPLPPSAHDVLREYRVIRALHDSDVPVPRPLVACDDPAAIGAPFYVMERVEGDSLRAELPPAFAAVPPVERAAYGEQAIDALAALHRLDPAVIGLEDLGRPSGYLARQLRRWRQQLDYARTRPMDDLDRVVDWLAARLPTDRGNAGLVHGDYKLDNLLFGPEPPVRLLAIVDWELATRGDPLADLGWFLAFWRQADDPPSELPIIPRLTELPGFSTRAELIERYAERVDTHLPDLTYYVVFAMWKMSVLLENHWARKVRGTAAGFDFDYLETANPAFAARIGRIVDRGAWA
ncbi:MAG: phosphotransferase family protein [Chloroflexota bacterium]|nr:phosphotransferase family protein [Chloroflexota bacterium]